METYNKSSQKECPLCRVKLVHRSVLKPDKKIDALMKQLVLEFEKVK